MERANSDRPACIGSDPSDDEVALQIKSTREAHGLSVLTWNVWFGDKYETEEGFAKRCEAIVASLGLTQPDVMCFQEVTQELLGALLASEWVKIGYDASCSKISSYGELILTRKALKARFKVTKFPSRMGRSLHTAHILVNPESKGASAERMVIGCVHLESLNSPDVRKKQLEICKSELSATSWIDDHLLVGDFNFCSYRNYNPEITPLENDMLEEVLPGYVDIWPALHISNKGYTFDSEANSLIDKYERMRYDRVMARCFRLKPRSIVRYGTREVDLKLEKEPVQEGTAKVNGGRILIRKLSILRGSRIHLSDHFGLLTCLTPISGGEECLKGTAKLTSQTCETCRVPGCSTA